MKDEERHFIPMRKDLLARRLTDELILYDTATKKAHCLNRTAAAVWRLCDGHKSAAEIARSLQQGSAGPADEGLVWMALCRLNEAGLLQNRFPSMIENNMLSRRELVKKMSVGTAMALPIARSILVPTWSAAASPARSRQAPSRRQRQGRRS